MSGFTTSDQWVPSEMASYRQSMDRSSEPKRSSSSSRSSWWSLFRTLWSVTSCVRKTANTNVITKSMKSVQVSDRRDSPMETTSMRRPPRRCSMRVSRRRRTSLKRRRMRRVLIWWLSGSPPCGPGAEPMVASPSTSSVSCRSVTSRSKTFQRQPRSWKKAVPLIHKRRAISRMKNAQKALSKVTKRGGVSTLHCTAMNSVSTPIIAAWRMMTQPAIQSKYSHSTRASMTSLHRVQMLGSQADTLPALVSGAPAEATAMSSWGVAE
mmetsp:Transcript_110286/g.307297  ORF Transcript_110286/g.307297 Transcript_110286/m.307297 type:complete len:266 (-) Transcript_110286:719-1516(-)